MKVGKPTATRKLEPESPPRPRIVLNTRPAAESKVESRALAKGLLLLEALAVHRGPMSLPELADVAGLGKPSTLRLLQTLVATGFAARAGDGSYVLNRRWISSSTDSFLQALMTAAAPEMTQLNADLAETVSLAAVMDDHIRVIHVIESPRHIRMSNYAGRILPPYASSLGKAIAAHQSPERLNTLLRVYGIYPFTKNTITEPAKIREEWAKVRKQGFAREHEETVEGGCCVGVAIPSGDGPVRAAISVSLPTSRLTGRMGADLAEALKSTAARISEKLKTTLVSISG